MAGYAVFGSLCALLACLGPRSAAVQPSPGAPDYQKDIQPLLRASCYGCHSGPQAMGQLHLDSRKLAMAGGSSGPVIVPGHSQDSRLIARVLGLGRAPRMPLGGKPLTDAQIGLLRRWIDAGAAWPDDPHQPEPVARKHWAYVKPVRPAVPQPAKAAWVRNPIDAFILARLEKEKLVPSPEAPREVLIRRLSLDLTGLLPAVREVDEFARDRSPDAYERLVDRLLSSPHFGERWARPWLDLARYADTNGYEKDRRRSIWKYRDWVIDAFNRDMPFDQFTVEQIAGDMLPHPTTAQLIATGFHRNTMFNEEGGVDKEEAHWENLVDRVNTTATVWLGTTLGCAQCHNHKFDPFTQREYYQFLAFFNGSATAVRDYGDTSTKYIEPELDLPTPTQEARRKALKGEIAGLETRLKTGTPELQAAQANWEKSVLAAPSQWTVLDPVTVTSTAGTTLTRRKDGAILAGGSNPAVDEYVIEARLPAGGITGIRIEALPDASLPRGGPGRDPYGNFFLSHVEAEIAHGASARPVAFREVAADDGRIEDKKFQQLWAVDASREDRRLPRQIVLIAEPSGAAADTLLVRIRQKSEFGGQGLGCFRLSVTASAEPKAIVGVSAKLRPAFETEPARRTPDERRALEEYYRSVAPSLADARQRLKQLRGELDKLAIVSTLVMGETPGFERPAAVMRVRGTFTNPGERVYAAVPAVLHPLPESAMPNRLGLARWLVSPDNPLTARVTVNRIWEAYFGRGIVETSEDFGSQGQPPAHPELLDWLATELVQNGWSLKKLHRLIVTSSTYRQSSAVTPALLERDPYNRLLARGPRFRVEAEMIRDIALAAGGLLSPRIGGPSVFPFQPEGIWDLPFNDDKWTLSEGEDRYRRGIYTFQRRTAPYPSLLTFDGTSREVCTVRRTRTNTPLQALTALNDPAFFEAAQAMALRIVREGARDARARAEYGFRLCVARRPRPEEVDRIVGALDKERTYFDAHPAEAAKIVRRTEPAGSNPAELAAWTMISNVLLNLDETLTKE